MSPTRLLKFVAVAAVPAVVLVACLKKDDQVVLNKDGSGTIVQTATIDKGRLEQLKGVLQMFGTSFAQGGPAMDGGGVEAAGEIEIKIEDVFSPDDLKARAKGIDGLEIKKAEASEKDGKATSRFELAFSSLEAAAKAGLFLEQSVELKKNEDGSYTLTFDLGLTLPGVGPAAPGGEAGMDGGKSPALPGGMDIAGLFAILEPIVGTLETKRTIVVPGTVVETNGEKKDVEGGGTSVSWTQVFKDVASGKKLAQKVTFKGEDLELKPFSYKPTLDYFIKRYVKITATDEGDGDGEGKEGKEKPPTPVTPNK